MTQNIELMASVLAFEVGEFCHHGSKGRSDLLHDNRCENVPSEDDHRSFKAKEDGELLGEHDDVEDGFGDVGVEGSERVGPFVDVIGQSLVWVADSPVDLGHLVEDNVLDVSFVEVIGELFSEKKAQFLAQVVEEGVDGGAGDAEHEEDGQALEEGLQIYVDDGLHHLALDASQSDAHPGSQDQADGQDEDHC